MIRDVTIDLRREEIDITMLSGHEPDPEWSFTDPMGHEHRFYASELPTLKIVETDTYWCPDCREEHTEHEYRCRLCGHRVDPRFRAKGPGVERFLGPVTPTLIVNGEVSIPLSTEEMEMALSLERSSHEAAFAFAQDILDDRGIVLESRWIA